MRATLKAQINLPRWAPLLLLGITILGGILRVHQIGMKGLWLDESFSVWLAWQKNPALIEWLLKVDQHPPLYYVILHFWVALSGSSPHSVRLLSALLGTLTVPVIYLIGKRLSGHDVGLLAAFILALSPFHVRFAQETRMYALLTLNASLAIWALVRLLTDPQASARPMGHQLAEFIRVWKSSRNQGTRSSQVGYEEDYRQSTTWVSAPTRQRWLPLRAIETDLTWIAYMVFSAATVLSHNTAIFLPIAVNIFVFGLIIYKRIKLPSFHLKKNLKPAQQTNVAASSAQLAPHAIQPPSLTNWILSQIGLFLLWSPWLAAFVVQAQGVYQEFWIPAPSWQTVVRTIHTFLNDFLPEQIRWDEWIWTMYGMIVLFGIIHFRRRVSHVLLLAILFSTPFIGEWLVSLRRPIFYDRTLIWTCIPLFLILGAGIAQLRYRPYILTALVVLTTIQGLSLRDYYRYFEKEQWNRAASYVAQRVENEDLILFNATWVQIPFDYYFKNYNRPVDERGVPVDLFDRGILEPKMASTDLPRLRSLIRGRDRIWLVYSHNWYTDPENLIPVALDEELELIDSQGFFGLELRLYGVP